MPGVNVNTQRKHQEMIHIKSYAKINLSIDMGEVLPSGMHPVDMIMQTTTLADDVIINVKEGVEFSVAIKTNSAEIPAGEDNIAYKAAVKMIEKYKELFSDAATENKEKEICIFIEKRIPVAAGLAGGSGNAAAVIHGLNAIWNLGLSLSELCEIGEGIGSDVPFCIMGQAKKNIFLPNNVIGDELAVSCARARGTGTELKPVEPIHAQVIIAKPNIGVSTGEVYKGMDELKIKSRPNNDALEAALNTHAYKQAIPEMINVLENYTLTAYPEVRELKTFMEENLEGALKVLMSGSGPSVFALFDLSDEAGATRGLKTLKDAGYEAHLARTF